MNASAASDTDRPRRQFMKEVGAVAAGTLLRPAWAGAASPGTSEQGVPRRELGRTGEAVSVLGVGGHTLALAANESESIRMVHAAIEGGINLMDNAWEYHDGRAESVMGKALEGRRDKVFLMTKVCAHLRGQSKRAVLEMLEESLSRLRTDRLDLWMLHELTTLEEVEAAYAPGGPLEGMAEAKEQGKVRFLGFTGHASPEVHLEMLAGDFPFDAVLMPINAFEANRTAFRTRVLPELRRRGIGILGMKALGGTPARVLRGGRYTAQQLIRYALSHPITAQVVGMRSMEDLSGNLKIAREFQPMPAEEMEALAASLTLDQADHQLADYHHPGYRDGLGVVG